MEIDEYAMRLDYVDPLEPEWIKKWSGDGKGANNWDVIIHDVMTVHGSGGNLSTDQLRRAVSLRYCGDDIRYCDRPGALAQPFLTEKPKDGAPLYSKDYPLVWPRPFPGAKIAPVFAGEHLVGPLMWETAPA